MKYLKFIVALALFTLVLSDGTVDLNLSRPDGIVSELVWCGI
jgi:hypothetical protein